jgi:para-aminobenzoate synthetase/4-amino-4-deoxychorismate lyase
LDPQPFLPLAWFGLYEGPLELTRLEPGGQPLPRGWQPEVSADRYRLALQQIKEAIAAGQTYQVNYTYRLRNDLAIPAYPLFARLAQAHQPPYAAFLETGGWAVCSFSPELFFRLEGEMLTSRPMKGTAARGRLLADDLELADWLQHSEKNRAENVMIVDMVRNDMGKIARTGSVQVPELFQVEKYPTVWQMTSTVTAESGAGLAEILAALFPCASITGAPKVRTMQVIRELETSPRRLYTGTLGYLAPGRRAVFNVAIRTLLLDKTKGQAEYGVGGGIVWDSEIESEWAEAQTKARVLFESPAAFDLLETLLWTPESGYFLLERHLQRLSDSAAYFDYPLDLENLHQKLDELASALPGEARRVRLLLSRNGQVHLEPHKLAAQPPTYPVGVASRPIKAQDRFLYHKTTRREIYASARQERPDCEDVLLWNARGELTEATIANLVVEQDGQLWTPPVSCGLLPGTYRGWLVEQGRVQEKTLYLAELDSFERLYLANSVRKLWEIELCRQMLATTTEPDQG